jgi:hypothetical protein
MGTMLVEVRGVLVQDGPQGDGSTVTCQGAGTPYTSADNPAAASPDCGHTYTSSSAEQPGGAFQGTLGPPRPAPRVISDG